ncbi:DUF1848 domain-containing protein [Eggerthella guodeyinii]|uniref:DUF1848 domain-containing protein n=1 Tax=Eggerthella guodeyinii TaxID=2690837 RepID=A0A6L7ITZ1_9ACTN|nr:DUF1848 domain-containing protein [Eggerthella guodeyinii]QOS69718.1 DUF1848 domain-containing protein [Eggerthella guodeyinii]
MIVSASRRTDIPRFHFDWLLRRFEEGFALVRNPMVRTQVSRVSLAPDAVDCIAFWTKNPAVLLARKDELDRAAPAPYFVQFTLNAYGSDVEAGLPRKAQLLDTFRALADALGPERVVWRYSPILVGGPYDIAHHLHWFDAFAKRLEGSTRACRIGFLDTYPKIAGRMAALGFAGVPDGEKAALALRLAELGAAHGIDVGGCGDGALDDAGLARAGCIDAALVERIAGVRAGRAPGAGRRGACRCAPSVEIGTYDTCANGCVYCYANPGTAAAAHGAADPWRLRRYDPASPMLCDEPGPDDTVVERAAAKLPDAPPRLF